MKSTKVPIKTRSRIRGQESPKRLLDQSLSSPDCTVLPKLWSHLKKSKERLSLGLNEGKSQADGVSASESNLPARRNELKSDENSLQEKEIPEQSEESTLPTERSNNMNGSSSPDKKCFKTHRPREILQDDHKVHRSIENYGRCLNSKKIRPGSPLTLDVDDSLTRQIKEIQNETRKSARIIRDSRARLLELQKRNTLTEADIKELSERNELLLREMERFDKLTRSIQKVVGAEVTQLRKCNEKVKQNMDYMPMSIYDTHMYHEMKMDHPTVVLGTRTEGPGDLIHEQTKRSKSEIDLTRKLSESYDMQEKLVADNADLEVKRYILYKELMTKDQNLETCRAQVKRLQGELKLMNKENTLLNEKLSKNNPEGDAAPMNKDNQSHKDSENCVSDKEKVEEYNIQDLVANLNHYRNSTEELEKELGQLEFEVRHLRIEMDSMKAGSACRGGGGGPNTCFEQPPGGPPVPPMTKAMFGDNSFPKAKLSLPFNQLFTLMNVRMEPSVHEFDSELCGVCPPCPAPCNPNAPPTPAEREVQKLTIQLRQTEENFKTKVTECAMLRVELVKKKEELEKERCQHREVQNKLRELEMKFEGLTTHTNMMLGSKEQAFEQEVNVRALKQCYREAREEIDELRTLLKEQNDQLQDYRVKYMQAQQLVEEQRRQMDMMDMDNTRISEQINLEIQRVKLKFQEKLQELAPIPDLLKATQMKLKDAQQSQAIAEHNAEQLARELNCAREKVHVLLHNSMKPPEKPPERGGDEKQMALYQQRISQLTEANMSLKSEIERLKANVIRMEECVLANEKRLQEKMHECAQIGGELDRARDEAARALQRANERTDTIRKCMQTTVAELERQLAASRARVKTAEKDREELQCRMQCQIQRLNENFEQAQLRVLGLQTQVQALRRTVSSTGEGEGDGEQECACKSMFDNA